MGRAAIILGILALALAVVTYVGLRLNGPMASGPPMAAQQNGAGQVLCAKRNDGSIVCQELGQREAPEGDCYAALNGPVCENPFQGLR